MGLVDFAILAVIALFLLSGFHKGFIWNLAALGASLASLVLAYFLMGGVAKMIVNNGTLYDAMLNYTEGAEYIYDRELVDREVTSLTNDEIDEIMDRSNLPFPLRDRVYENIMNESFREAGITTLGDYFNESMVLTAINIISFLFVYFAARVALTFLICWLDYAFKFPRLRIGDSVVGAAIGLVRGVIDVTVIFMIVPIVLVVLPFDAIEELITASKIANFLHRSNMFLKLIPGTV